jgi:hypothetical protein
LKVSQLFGGTYRLHLQLERIIRAINSVKAGGKQKNRLAKIWGYMKEAGGNNPKFRQADCFAFHLLSRWFLARVILPA